MTISSQSIIVGIDVHKYSHTAVAVNAFGADRGVYTFSNDTIAGFQTWLQTLCSPDQLVVGIEDVHNTGHHVSRVLVQSGILTRYVPPILTDRARKSSLNREKTDEQDARRVAKAIITKSEETLPADPIIQKSAKDMRALDLLLQERTNLTRFQTAVKNQLHVLLHTYYGDVYAKRFKTIFSDTALLWYLADLSKRSGQTQSLDDAVAECPDGYLIPTMRRRIEQLQLIKGQLKVIAKQQMDIGITHVGIRALVEQIPGCGWDSACHIAAEIKDIHRFRKAAQLVRYARLAPVSHSSGQRVKFHTPTFGNNRLNQALHHIALSQITVRGNEHARVYYQKKQDEGKSKLWSIRCLKRYLCVRVFHVLKNAG